MRRQDGPKAIIKDKLISYIGFKVMCFCDKNI